MSLNKNIMRVSRMNSKIQRTSLQSEIIRYIQNYIQENGLKPGDRLPSQEKLIEMMGVSRTSLREAMKTLDDYRRFKAAVKVPILANLTEFGSTPLFTTDELRSANVDIALYCCGAYRAMNAAALNFYQTVLRDGTQKAAVETMQTRADLYQYLGYHAYEDKLDALFAAQK